MPRGPHLRARILDGLLLPTELGPVEAPAPVLEDTVEGHPMSLYFEGRIQRAGLLAPLLTQLWKDLPCLSPCPSQVSESPGSLARKEVAALANFELWALQLGGPWAGRPTCRFLS